MLESKPSSMLQIEIAHLRDLDLAGLRARWRTTCGRQAPAHLPRHLLLRLLAYRIQAETLGDLDPATVRFLDRLAGRSGEGTPEPPNCSLRAGTILVREWDGASHHVTVLEEGFAWNGVTYKSLSEVARAITGTRWNGPRFFGLREKGP
jgi:Protein of unknown function (DUF2924)